jgi:hypothetical protein
MDHDEPNPPDIITAVQCLTPLNDQPSNLLLPSHPKTHNYHFSTQEEVKKCNALSPQLTRLYPYMYVFSFATLLSLGRDLGRCVKNFDFDFDFDFYFY